LPEETRDYDYNAINQLLSITNPNLTFVYDDDGNMIQGYTPDGYVFTADYDAEDRMTSLEYTDSSSVVHRTEYRYSGDGFLAEIRKHENSALVETVRIVRDGFLAIQDRDENNTVLREYTWGLNLGGGIGGLLNLKQGGQDYAYLYDGKGNVAAVLDASQSVVAAYRYAPFGELLAKTGSLTQPFGFSTKRYDKQTGLIHYQYRPYAPEIGRWLTRDPLGETGGMNLYAFVGNNPVNWVDPWGLYRSHWLLRALVPGQVAWDRAITAVENGDPLGAGLNAMAMIAEQALFVWTLGEASALVQASASVLPTSADLASEMCSDGGGNYVIGRTADLAQPGTLKPGEMTLEPMIEAVKRIDGSYVPRPTVKSNLRALRIAMSKGLPIRDISPKDKNGSYLNMERIFLESRGWKPRVINGETWYFPPE
jgi:RHS repeat-associated protein